MDAPCSVLTYSSVCAMPVCCVRLLLSEQCTVNNIHMQKMRKLCILTNFYYSNSIIWNQFQWFRYSGMNIPIRQVKSDKVNITYHMSIKSREYFNTVSVQMLKTIFFCYIFKKFTGGIIIFLLYLHFAIANEIIISYNRFTVV